MAKADLKLDQLIDSAKLRADLTALTADHDGDGTSNDVRAAALALLKEINATGREKAEAMLMEDGGGNLCATRLSYLQDEIIRCLYDFAIIHVFRVPNLTKGERMAILAVGGYGRGTLAPGSDLDLLFLLPYKQTALVESIVEYMLYMLWDMGYKVGHATRTLDECIRLSREDMTIRTAILEARYLWGNEDLYEDLVTTFDQKIVSKTAPEFIAAKLAERDARHEKSGKSRYLVEPNVKDGKGGQRDLHTLFWIAKYYYRLRTQAELRKAGVFRTREFNTFKKAQDFLWAIRCHLHFMTGRAEERLSFDVQRELAKRLGYQDHPGMSAVERFMKHYFLVAKDVGDLTRILCSALEEGQAKQVSGLSGIFRSFTRRKHKIEGTDQFLEINNRIIPVDGDVFKRDAGNIIKMFRLAEENGFLFHPDAMQLVARSFRRINKALRTNPQANEDFLAVLTSPKTPERTLRKMNESGVLGRFIPEFGKIVAMMQFNMYHHYTVDEHLLRSIGVLSEIEHGEVGEQHPLANQIMPNTERRKELYMALLLHDIAKGRPEDHSIAGARIAKKICPRFGFDASQTQFIAWLVEQHLVMSNVAQSRDLNDQRTITDFAAIMQNMDRMKALLVLTVCDIKAVGPGVWNGWKGQLLRTLYYETEPVLTGGFTSIPRHTRIANVLDEIKAGLPDWDEKERDAMLALHYDNYLMTVEREDQIQQMNFIRESDLQGKKIASLVKAREFEGITEITILSPDHPNLLSIVAGCCAALEANIVDAQIFTMRDGRALETVCINRAFNNSPDEYRRAERISSLIEKVLSGEAELPKILAEKSKARRKSMAFKVPPTAIIDNSLSDKFTVIELECRDRPALLSEVARQLAGLSLNITSAHIATFGEKVNDTFYVTDLTRQKIIQPERIATIKATLLKTLEIKPAAKRVSKSKKTA